MDETKIEMKLEEETKSLKKVCEKLEEVVKHQFDNGVEQINTNEMSEVIDMWKDVCEAKEKIVKSCYYTFILSQMEKEQDEEKEYKKLMEKMRESGDTDEDDMERRYYDNYRYRRSGRFAPKGRGSYTPRRSYDGAMMPMDMDMYRNMSQGELRDMDRRMGRLYYTEPTQGSGANTGADSGRSYTDGYSEGQRRGYEEGMNAGRRMGGQRDMREGRSGMSRRNYMDTKELHKDNTPQDKEAKMKELENYMKELSEDVTEMISGATPEEKTMLKNKMQVLLQKIN